MDARDVFPARAGFPEAFRNVADVPRDATALRLIANPQNFTRLAHLPLLERLWCFNLNAKSAPVLGSLASLRRLYVDGVRLSDFSALARLSTLEILSLETCTRVDSLEVLAHFRRVRGLAITNFPRIHSLKPLTAFESLRALVVAGGMWTRMTVESLEPLAALNGLEYLHLTNLKALDDSLEPLSGLTAVKTLELPNFYPVEEFAKLSVRLTATTCTWFAPYVPMQSLPCPRCHQATMVMLTGKGKSTVCRSCDKMRLQKHEELFRSVATKSA